jgi:hypothetical protein
MIFTPKISDKTENKFGRNIQALTFALPFKKRAHGKPRKTED